MGALGTSIAIRLIGTGLDRACSFLFQKISRLGKIDKELKAIAEKNPIAKAAIDDFEIVLGSYIGNYSVSVAQFLDELQRTGIIDVIAENALLERDSEQVKEVFVGLHKRFIDENGPGGDDLFQSINTSFRVTLRELCKDQFLRAAIVASHKEISAKLKNIDEILQTQISRSHKSGYVRFDELQPTLAKIAKTQSQKFKNVKIETNKGARDVEINAIYIPPDLDYKFRDILLKQVSEQFSKLERISGNKISEIMNHSSIGAELAETSYIELSNHFRRVVILGDPGGGKSTFCQKLCYDLSKNSSFGMEFSGIDELPAKGQRLALRVVIRQFEKAREKDHQLDIFSFIARDLVHSISDDGSLIRSSLSYLLESGRAVLAFDGLDEILDTSRRQDFVDLVEAFCNKYPLCPVLVTSRSVGYNDAPLNDDFERVYISSFNRSQVSQYLSKFLKVIGGLKGDELKLSVDKFMNATDDRATDLRSNPLMLGLMSWLYLNVGDIPANRPEIYRECAILMFDRWDQKRGIVADYTDEVDRIETFSSLASKIYVDPDLLGGVSRQWLEGRLKESFDNLYESKAKSNRAAKGFVDFITGRAWIMSDVGDDTYAFTHQTFLEFFFARYLDNRYETLLSLFSFLKPRILKSEWNQVAHLALQIKVNKSWKRQEEALLLLQVSADRARSLKGLIAISEFTVQSLEYLAPPEKIVGQYLDNVFERLQSGSRLSEFAFHRIIGKISNLAGPRQQFILNHISKKIAKLLVSDGESAMAGAGLLGGYSGSQRFDHSRARRGRALNPEILIQSRDIAQAAIFKLSETSSVHAAIKFFFYGVVKSHDFEKFGLVDFYRLPSPMDFDELDGLFSCVISTMNYIDRSMGYWPSYEDAKEFLTQLAMTNFEKFSMGKLKEFMSARHPLYVDSFFWQRTYQRILKDSSLKKGVKAGFVVVRHIHLEINNLPEHRSRAATVRTQVDLVRVEKKIIADSALPPEIKQRLERLVSGDISVFRGIE